MKRGFPVELVYQVFSLLIAFILVHALYVSFIRPQATSFLEQEALLMQSNPEHVQQRSFFVVIKDYEQETCFILMLWAFAILGLKGRTTWRQQQLLDQDLLRLPADLPIGPEDTRDLAGRLQSLPASMHHYLLPRALLTAIERFEYARVAHLGNGVAGAVDRSCARGGLRLQQPRQQLHRCWVPLPGAQYAGDLSEADAPAPVDRTLAGRHRREVQMTVEPGGPHRIDAAAEVEIDVAA